MASQAAASPLPIIPSEVEAFASHKGIDPYLPGLVNLARGAFPSCALAVSLGQDAEDETHQYIALDIDVGGLATEELLAGQQTWSAGIPGVCPSRHAVYFVLGWR